MCYEEKDYGLDRLNGIKVKALGRLCDESWQLAEVYVEDGAGIERLLRIVESERSEWDGFSFEVSTVDSIDDVIWEELQTRREWALVRLFYDEFEYKSVDEKGRDGRLEGIAEITGQPTQIYREYMALLYQVDESLVPDSWKCMVETYPKFVDDRTLEHMRKSIRK